MNKRLTLLILMMAEFLALSFNERSLVRAQPSRETSPPSSPFLTLSVNSHRDENRRDRRVEFFLLNIQGIEIQLIDQQEDIQIEGK
jgi:hypothetical protein